MEKILGLPVIASEHGKNVDALIIYVHWLMAALFVGWFAFFVYTLFRFRKGRHPKADYTGAKTHMSTYIEVAVAGVEGVLLFVFAVPLWAKSADKFPDLNQSTVIQVVAQQFAWNARYPGKDGKLGAQDPKFLNLENPLGVDRNDPNSKDDIETLNDLHVPIGKPVVVYLTSKDVIHSFKLIAARVTQDAIPGMRIPFWFRPTTTGRFQINCAQLCGAGHSSMAQGFLTVDKPEEFDVWVASKAKSTGAPATFE